MAVQDQRAALDLPADRRDVFTCLPHDGARRRGVRADVCQALHDRAPQRCAAFHRDRGHTCRAYNALPHARRPRFSSKRPEPLCQLSLTKIVYGD